MGHRDFGGLHRYSLSFPDRPGFRSGRRFGIWLGQIPRNRLRESRRSVDNHSRSCRSVRASSGSHFSAPDAILGLALTVDRRHCCFNRGRNCVKQATGDCSGTLNKAAGNHLTDTLRQRSACGARLRRSICAVGQTGREPELLILAWSPRAAAKKAIESQGSNLNVPFSILPIENQRRIVPLRANGRKQHLLGLVVHINSARGDGIFQPEALSSTKWLFAL